MDKLLKILKRVKPDVDFAVSNNLIDEGILDSVDIVSIISEIETEYSIEIEPDEIEADNFQSALAILNMIKKVMENN